jgi:hypothetical protein
MTGVVARQRLLVLRVRASSDQRNALLCDEFIQSARWSKAHRKSLMTEDLDFVAKEKEKEKEKAMAQRSVEREPDACSTN